MLFSTTFVCMACTWLDAACVVPAALCGLLCIDKRHSDFQADLQRRQIGDILEFAPDFGQLVLQLLLLAVQLQQLGCEGDWIVPSWSVSCRCSMQVHKQLLVALHPLIQLLYILVLSNV